MVVVDVPVELDHALFRLHLRTGRHFGAADVEAVAALRDVLDAADLVRADADGGAGAAADGAEFRTAAAAFVVFGQGEEEQLVLDQRAADPQALGVVLEVRRVVVAVGGAVVALADQAVVAGHVVGAAVVHVGTRLGDGVDIGAGVAALGHVVVGDVDLHRGDGFHRDRLAGGRAAVGFQAEGVVHGHAVDGHRVVARVLAGHGHFAAVLVGLRDARIETREVLQVAVDRCLGFQVGARDRGDRAHRLVREDFRAGSRTGHGDGLHLLAQGGVDGGGFRQLDEHAFAALGDAVLGDDDRVRAAYTQATCNVTAFCVGRDIADRTGLGVNNLHLGADCRIAVSGRDTATDGRGGVLREGRRSSQCNRQSQRQFGEPDLLLSDH